MKVLKAEILSKIINIPYSMNTLSTNYTIKSYQGQDDVHLFIVAYTLRIILIYNYMFHIQLKNRDLRFDKSTTENSLYQPRIVKKAQIHFPP